MVGLLDILGGLLGGQGQQQPQQMGLLANNAQPQGMLGQQQPQGGLPHNFLQNVSRALIAQGQPSMYKTSTGMGLINGLNAGLSGDASPYEMQAMFNSPDKQGVNKLAALAGLQKLNDPLQQSLLQSEVAKNNSMAKLYDAGGASGANLQAFNMLKKSHPEMDDITIWSMVKSGLGQGITTQNGTVTPMAGAPEAAGAMKFGEKAGGARGELTVKREADLPAATAKINSVEQSQQFLNDKIDEVTKQADGIGNTGFLGSITKNVPGTPSYDMARNLDTIKSNIGFDKLQQMRDQSPTGGALGQVSDFENKLLQSVWGSVEQSQSKEQLLKNLDNFKKQYATSIGRVRDAYKATYGNTQGFDQSFSQPSSSSTSDTNTQSGGGGGVVSYQDYFR